MNEEATLRIANSLAEYLEINTFATRSGPIVQNPETLFQELNEVGLYKAEIVLIIGSTKRTILLSHNKKKKFIEVLEYSDVNSGLVASKFIDD